MIKFIFYIFVFYVVMKILRIFIDPFFSKSERIQNLNQEGGIPPKQHKPTVGEYIEYEEIKN